MSYELKSIFKYKSSIIKYFIDEVCLIVKKV